ncbi:MAG: hypothetical protein RR595_14625, partial [Lysinibacillus sp.]
PDDELQVKLFLNMSDLLKVKGAHFNIQTEIEYACEQMIDKAYDLQKGQDKQFKVFTSGRTEDKAQQLITYQMKKIFESLDASMGEMTDIQQGEFIEQLEQFIQSLSPEKQKEIQQKLGVEKLTKKTLQHLVTTQGAVIVLTVLVEVAGFAAFTTLTSLMAWFVGLFGATLPFGVYIFATSTLSVITGPFAIAAAIVGGGALIKHQNDKVKKMFIPIGVVQLLLITTMEDTANDDGTAFISYWKKLYEHQQALQLAMEQQQQLKTQLNEQLSHTNSRISEIMEKRVGIVKTIGEQYEIVRSMLPVIPISDFSTEALQLKEDMQQITNQIERQHRIKNENKGETGFLKTVKNTFSNLQIDSTVEKMHKNYSNKERQLVEELVRIEPPILYVQNSKIHEMNKEKENNSEQRKQLIELKMQLTKNISEAESVILSVKKQLTAHQKQNYGLKHIE